MVESHVAEMAKKLNLWIILQESRWFAPKFNLSLVLFKIDWYPMRRFSIIQGFAWVLITHPRFVLLAQEEQEREDANAAKFDKVFYQLEGCHVRQNLFDNDKSADALKHRVLKLFLENF